ncbi:bifunctional oligoribonuclease/PAP phosphatase NrnA [Candidatus Uhrbacteria bacterium]|nr:bifunctional oligoribonuclease/PAP phosphatase NrnA [Candidatus Uhrbacteria bacterium]
MQEFLAQEIVAKLKSARKVLLVMHRRPDPDSIGSAAAMGEFLELHGIAHAYYCVTAVPAEARRFGIEPTKVFNPDTLKEAILDFDVIMTFDAGDLKHAGLEEIITPPLSSPRLLGRMGGVGSFIINFDHHATNARFGNFNLVEVGCASTTELLYRFFEALNFPISARIATCLLAGLLVDTDHFFNPATTGSALQVAAAMMSRGVTLTELRQFLFERRGIRSLKLIGEVLARLYRPPRYDIAVAYLTEEDIERHGVDAEDLDGIANLLNAIGDAQAMLFLKSGGGFIRGSLRTTRKEVNVGRLAELLGGGGHRKAAGFTLAGALRAEGNCVRVV